jgi:YD repeat-containing protein
LKTTYGYNDAGEMVTATVKGKATFYSHDPNGNLVSTLHPSGILDERSYDAAGRLTKIKGKDSHGRFFYVRSYTYDAAGNPLTQKAIGPRSHSHGWWGNVLRYEGHHALARWQESYSYDSRDRLTKACMNESCSHYYSYSYDPVGNRTKLETKKSETSYSYDAADELDSLSHENGSKGRIRHDRVGYVSSGSSEVPKKSIQTQEVLCRDERMRRVLPEGGRSNQCLLRLPKLRSNREVESGRAFRDDSLSTR